MIQGRELQGIIISLLGYVLVAGSLNHALGSFYVKYPWFIGIGALALFIASKYFIKKIPFLGREDSFIGETIHIIITISLFTLFIKSLAFYVQPYFQAYTWGLFALGMLIMLYAVKFHLKGTMGGN